MAEALAITQLTPIAPRDLTEVAFVTIDPPGSMDLDQAMHLERTGDGFRVRYAIADLGGVFEMGGAIDTEARRRGQTIYLPDGRVPLHPVELSEGALSLLPDQVRRAVVWTLDVNPDGAVDDIAVERALVRSVARLDYGSVQADADAGRLHPSIEVLPDFGRLRRQARLVCGAIDLALPSQQVVRAGDAWTIRIEPRTEVDRWNAEVSLLAGMAAAQVMLRGNVGLLRNLPSPSQDEVDLFMDLAQRLGHQGADGSTPGQVLAGLDMMRPTSLALNAGATRLLRGAGYVAFDGETPDVVDHAGIGGPYAHVTAPLRRLADRFGTEVCLALCAGEPVADELRNALPEIADAMRDGDRRASAIDRGSIDQVEVWLAEQHRDVTREAVVLRDGTADRPAEIMMLDPAVVSECKGSGLKAGATVGVKVSTIDADRRKVTYQTV